jgi:hypothetical protein
MPGEDHNRSMMAQVYAWRHGVLAGLACGAGVPAFAQSEVPAEPAQWVFQADTRLRYEFAEAADQPLAGDALTVRVRPNVEFSPHPAISLLAEAEAIASLLPDRQNGFLGSPDRPQIADQETLELNRLQIEFAPSENVSIALGRQRISIDDERFIGTVDFRQNQQTYDAVTASLRGPGDVLVRTGYIWRVGRVLGPEQRDGVFDSDSFFVNAAAPLPFGQVSAFHFDLDLDDRTNASVRSQTTGVAIRGRTPTGDRALLWEAIYARQHSQGSTPHFLRVAITGEARDLSLGVKVEHLGSDGGIAFQTPLATLHRFQGAADLFLVTPPDGITDVEGSVIWRIGSLGQARATQVSVQYNAFWSAVGDRHYGQEWGGEFAATLGPIRLSLAAAHFAADDFAADTTRVWLTATQKF